jgi:hypothetical protein
MKSAPKKSIALFLLAIWLLLLGAYSAERGGYLPDVSGHDDEVIELALYNGNKISNVLGKLTLWKPISPDHSIHASRFINHPQFALFLVDPPLPSNARHGGIPLFILNSAYLI